MIKRVFAATGNFWIGRIQKELKSLINRRRSICQNYEEDIFNDVVIELLEAGTSFPDLPEDQDLTRIIDRVCQRWNRQLRIRHSTEVRLDDEFIEVLSFKQWRNLIAERMEDFFPATTLNQFPIINIKNHCHFFSTIYKGTSPAILSGGSNKKNPEIVANKKVSPERFKPSRLKDDVDIKTLDGLHHSIESTYGGFRLSPILKSNHISCDSYFQFQNFCPICRRRRQCLSIVEKTNGSFFYHCFHPDADEILKDLGVRRKSIPKLLAIIGEAAKDL